MDVQNKPNGEVAMGDMEYDGRLIFYIIKADETSYINYIKPLILARELQFPHVLSCIDTHDAWYYSVHPERYVPALKDQNPETGEKVVVFEGTACLQYIVDRFDTEGLWGGRTAFEKGCVLSWTAYQTAGIWVRRPFIFSTAFCDDAAWRAISPPTNLDCLRYDRATAKYWLYFLRGYSTRKEPVQLPRTIEKLHSNVLKQWDVMEKRLAEPGQDYFLGVDIKDWPHIQAWSQRMLDRPAVKEVMAVAPKYGHT
ncbi:Glutathione s-transferase [Colletotrichum higginsianum IMI 349063]|uniref:glutathione transferase n=1 Tax=Colletotrichum higginsianum (strain IMI 349063) TaxID=759273 RepID=A0A1B7YJY6_COLHI|nr:Glutathione s-transferase [Colletotrichum higginsianum IMI 349063]OBR12350.1 Glutathione s-transferase [Colletotrichum higginsianum IMI 349063]GJC94035.1 glutathione s-transferase [Colletotrichum higginsianum]